MVVIHLHLAGSSHISPSSRFSGRKKKAEVNALSGSSTTMVIACERRASSGALIVEDN